MDFEKICMMFTMQEPYYGILLSAMERIPTKTITPTMAVGRSGNVFKLYYNPDWVGQFDVDTTLLLIKHEILHLAFGVFTIWGGEDKNDTKELHKIRNIAADLEVNSYLDRSKMDKRVEGVWAEDFGWKRYEGTREYFARLMQQAQQQAQAKHPQQPCNGGQGQGQSGQSQKSSSSSSSQQSQQSSQNTQSGNNQSSGGNSGIGDSEQDNSNGNQQSNNMPSPSELKEYADSLESFDDHSQWPDCDSQTDMEQMNQIVEDLLVFAADEIEKARGNIPGELTGKIKFLRERKKPKPVADWKRYFRRYLGNEFSEFIRKSKKRESRRFPDAAGNRHRRKSHILVAIDTSGSVSMPEYREFFGQIKTLTANADFHVVECDATIQHEYDYKGRPNETLHGGGGTDFQPVIDLYNKDKRKYDALVYFTDGYCDIPKDTPKDTLWVISSNGDQHNRKKYKVNGASVAFIPKHD